MPVVDALILVLCAAFTALAAGQGCRLGAYRRIENYEGRPVWVAGLGLAMGLATGLGAALALSGGEANLAALVALLGFALFGALDDVRGDRSASGFRGHLRAALAGRLTTGFWKIVGGGLTALIASWLLPGADAGRILLDAAVIALGANALNLLDTRPVRATAAFLAMAVLTVALGGPRSILFPGIACALAWLPFDRARKGMLGDAGSNALGAVWAVAAVASAPWQASAALLAALVAFHAFTEVRSINATIAAHPALDRLDRWIRG